ncbi:SMP-30/gluconolactonase/LRE family protein [Gordonia insulae]|uniref:Virginiamycin B lyase n=1 Tax=Gordonia insulae TaxID=2420509 RepID=A0A3G8JKP5_9ACTN|nr:SMP-30/gluconolactonase/LRE family protein [Gordonia insulae]AZG45112.1 Virginiamycin B lyase [Gordonia insulae]
MTQAARFTSSAPLALADGWRLERLTDPSRLFGANGIRSGPDGRIYIAQVAGSQISALDLDSGALETISAKGSDIIAPDDVAFDDRGDMYVTEYYDGRVSVRASGGATRMLRDDLPGANGITIHQGRLFVNECRPGGRLMEVNPDGGSPKILLEDLPMPNGMEVGPDGKLYYPLLGANEIWRIDPDGGEPERVATDLGGPDAVKFDSDGFIVSTQVASGQVLRIDPRTGDQTLLAQLSPGLDNLTFAGDRLFVSSFTGQITEILADGATRTALADGLTWPLDLAVGPDGTLYIADGTFLLAYRGGELSTLGMLFSPGYPGYIRGMAAIGDGELIVTGNGSVSRYRPGAAESEVLVDGLDQLYGVAVSTTGAIAVADLGSGSVFAVQSGRADVLASGLDRPMGVAFTADGTCLVTESGAGRVAAVTNSGTDTLVDGLESPQGIVVVGSQLYIVDAGSKSLVNVDLETKSRQVVATGLPVGAPPGVTPKPLLGLVPFSGPQGPFAGISAGPDGTLYISADADGSVVALRKGA